MLTYFLSHQIYRYVIYMFIMYSIFKNTPNLNLQNKMITHITLLATIMNYVMDNVSEISKQELSKKKNIEKFKNKKLFAIAAIGNPENFFKILENNNLLVEKKKIYPDHYVFSKNEVRKIFEEAKKENFELIMTEKDYFKIKDFGINEINYLQVELEIKDKNRLIDKIITLNDKNN